MLEFKAKLSKIFTFFGVRNQANKIVEEAVELRDAMTSLDTAEKYFLDDSDEAWKKYALFKHVLEEWTDCVVILNQIWDWLESKNYVQDMQAEHYKIYIQKINRTLKRINEGYYGNRFRSKKPDVH